MKVLSIWVHLHYQQRIVRRCRQRQDLSFLVRFHLCLSLILIFVGQLLSAAAKTTDEPSTTIDET